MQSSVNISRYTMGLIGQKMREHAKFGELNDEDYEWYKELEKFFGSFGDLSDYSEEEALKVTIKAL